MCKNQAEQKHESTEASLEPPKHCLNLKCKVTTRLSKVSSTPPQNQDTFCYVSLNMMMSGLFKAAQVMDNWARADKLIKRVTTLRSRIRSSVKILWHRHDTVSLHEGQVAFLRTPVLSQIPWMKGSHSQSQPYLQIWSTPKPPAQARET